MTQAVAIPPSQHSSKRATMRAAVVTSPGHVEVREVPLPRPRGNEVRVKIEGCGVCASNIPPWEGRPWFQYPFVPGQLGHEAWGRVDEVGSDVLGFSAGDRVAMISEHAYAEYDIAPETSVVALPDSLRGAPFPAEPLGCAINVFHRSGIRAGQTVAIVGIGFLGAILTQLVEDAGACAVAIGRRPFALEAARRAGAAHAIPMDDHERIIEQVRQLTGGRFCDVVIEAVGKQWPLDLAGAITSERGRLIIAGYHQDGLRNVNMQLWNWRGLDVINAHERDPKIYLRGMREAVEAVASGRIDPSALYTHTYPLECIGDALNATKERPDGFMKALVMM